MLSLLDVLVSREQYDERLQWAERQRLVNVHLHETRSAPYTRFFTWLRQVMKRQTRDVRTITPRRRTA